MVLKAEPGRLDIKRHEPGNRFISLLIVSLVELAKYHDVIFDFCVD